MSFLFATSQTTGTTGFDDEPISAAVASSVLASRPVMMTFAPRLRETGGQRFADSATASGNERDFVGNRKQRVGGHEFPFGGVVMARIVLSAKLMFPDFWIARKIWVLIRSWIVGRRRLELSLRFDQRRVGFRQGGRRLRRLAFLRGERRCGDQPQTEPHPTSSPQRDLRAPRLAAFLQRRERSRCRSSVDLPGPIDATTRVGVLLAPVSDPAGQTADCEHDREHVRGDAHRAVNDTAVEIDVWVQLAAR